MKTRITTFPNIPAVDSPEFGVWLQRWYEANQGRSGVQAMAEQAVPKAEQVAPIEVVNVPREKVRVVKRTTETHPEMWPKVTRSVQTQTKTRQKLDMDVALRSSIKIERMCATCHNKPARAHGYCESCWQMWIDRKVSR